ncbi:MAG: hypothetical protein JSR98_06680 [Proteobacteria bacterium]|nr:hypothetical protein [Pseudomonadota bacterium]
MWPFRQRQKPPAFDTGDRPTILDFGGEHVVVFDPNGRQRSTGDEAVIREAARAIFAPEKE